MQKKPFGRTTWQVSQVGFGCWGLGGGWGHQDDAAAQAALQEALGSGINFFDTAYVYGEGHSETILGEALAGISSEQALVASKVPAKTMSWPATPELDIRDAFPVDWFMQCTETSLKRLGRETLDLQQMHVWTDAWWDKEEWQDAAYKLKKQGKIRAFGVSVNDHQPETVLKAVKSGAIDSVQVIYNIFEQAPAEVLLDLCQEYRVAVIVRVPFDEGSLTGAFSPDTVFDENDWRKGYFGDDRLSQVLDRVEKLKPLLGDEAQTLSEMALRFCLSHPAVSTVIPGMRKVANVQRNIAAAGKGPLPDDLLEELSHHAWQRNFYKEAFA